MYRSQFQYLIQWIWYDFLMWEPAKFEDGFQAVDEFHQHYPGMPAPLESILRGPEI